jgi:hypothetical protein
MSTDALLEEQKAQAKAMTAGLDADLADKQREQSRKHTRMFASEHVNGIGYRLRKPPMGAMTILTEAGNRFVFGFSKQELEELGLTDPKNTLLLPNSNIVKYTRDLWQWVVISEADEDELCEWFDSPEAFRKAVAKRAMRDSLTTDRLTMLFVSVWEILAEIQEAEVSAKPDRAPGQHKSPKKKAKPRRTSRRTPPR